MTPPPKRKLPSIMNSNGTSSTTIQPISDEQERQIIRQFREKASAGHCFICLEDATNMLTLCCGAASHIHCLAEWLRNKDSCPQCRAKIFPLPNSTNREDESSFDLVTALSPLTELGISQETQSEIRSSVLSTIDRIVREEAVREMRNQVRRRLEAAWYEDESSSGSSYMSSSSSNSSNVDSEDQDDLSNQDQHDEGEDDSNSSSSDDEMSSDDNGGDGESVGGVLVAATSPAVASGTVTPLTTTTEFCVRCGNRAATNCANTSCGRCCVTFGDDFCSRHNDTDTTDTDDDDASSSSSSEEEIESESEDSNTDCYTTSDDDSTMDNDSATGRLCEFCDNHAALDCCNSCCARCCAEYYPYACGRHPYCSETEDESTDDNVVTTTLVPSSGNAGTSTDDDQLPTFSGPKRCQSCKNRAAADCANSSCGRCCSSHAPFDHPCLRYGN